MSNIKSIYLILTNYSKAIYWKKYFIFVFFFNYSIFFNDFSKFSNEELNERKDTYSTTSILWALNSSFFFGWAAENYFIKIPSMENQRKQDNMQIQRILAYSYQSNSTSDSTITLIYGGLSLSDNKFRKTEIENTKIYNLRPLFLGLLSGIVSLLNYRNFTSIEKEIKKRSIANYFQINLFANRNGFEFGISISF